MMAKRLMTSPSRGICWHIVTERAPGREPVARENERNARVVPSGLTSFLVGVPRTSSWAKFFVVAFGTQMLGALALRLASRAKARPLHRPSRIMRPRIEKQIPHTAKMRWFGMTREIIRSGGLLLDLV